MFKSGVVSVSFRALSAEEVIKITKDAGLEAIEWGSDVHAPVGETERLRRIAELQKDAGLYCSSYGTYFRIGENSIEELIAYIESAKILGTNVLRLWCGKKNYEDCTKEEKLFILEESRKAARIAEREGAVLCMECHNNTFTNSFLGALELMNYVKSPAFRMYWQPSTTADLKTNLEYAKAIAPYTANLHVFYYENGVPRQLEFGIDSWKEYLSCFPGDRHLLLEFMPDKKPESLGREAAALLKLKENNI